MANDVFFTPVPGPKMLEAIGAVTVKWSALEMFIDNLLYRASDPADIETEKIRNTGSTRQRWRRLCQVLNEDYANHPGTTEIVGLISKALDLKHERDLVVHGIYSDTDLPRLINLIGVKRNTAKGKDWGIDRFRIIETASKIDRLVAKIIDCQMRYPTKVSDDSWLFGSWRHADRE